MANFIKANYIAYAKNSKGEVYPIRVEDDNIGDATKRVNEEISKINKNWNTDYVVQNIELETDTSSKLFKFSNPDSVNVHYEEFKKRYADNPDPTTNNLIQEVADMIAEVINPESKEIFMANADIAYNYNKSAGVQRVVINRYLNNTLFTFRSFENVPVNDIIYLTTYDGDALDWLFLLKTEVFPFMRDHNIFFKVAAVSLNLLDN